MGGEAASVGIDKRTLYLAVLIQMTWPGSPAVYYGDEVGQVGWTDPDSRRTYPWGREDWEVYDVHKSAIALRKKIHCLKMGSLIKLDAGNGYIVYGRFDATDCAIVAINSGDKEVSLNIPVWKIVGKRADSLKLMYTVGTDYGTYAEREEFKFGRMFLRLAPKSGCVYGKAFN